MTASTPTRDVPVVSAPARAAHPLRPALVIAGLLLVAANLRVGITAVGPVLAELQRDLGLPSASASILISLPLLAFAAVSPVAPALARRLGMERTLALALAALVVGLVLRSVPGAPLLWIGTALLGVAIAVLNVVLPALVKRDFPTRIGQLTGTYSAVQAIFAALSAGIAVPLAAASALGWRLPLAAGAVLAVVAILVLVPQLRRHSTAAPADDDVRLEVGEDAEPATRESGTGPAARRSPWRSALAWQITVFMGLQSVAYYVLITWLPSIEAAAGRSAAIAGVDLLVLNGCGILGSLGCSALIARLRDQRVLAAAAPALFLVAAGGMLLAPTVATLWAGIAGVAGGACIVLALSFFGLRTTHHRDAAALSGMAQAVGYLLAAAGPIAAGALHDATGSWVPALAGIVAVAVVLVVLGTVVGRDRTI